VLAIMLYSAFWCTAAWGLEVPDSSFQWGILINGKPAQVVKESDLKQGGLFGTLGGGLECSLGLVPSIERVLPSRLLLSAECDTADFTSTLEVAYFLLRSTGDTVRTNCPISLQISARPNSGGHCHGDTERPTGTPVPGTYTGNLLGGYHRVTHSWPELSGWILVQVLALPTCPNSTFINSENFWIAVRMPSPNLASAGLALVPENPAQYTLIESFSESRHPDNHFLIPEAIPALQRACADAVQYNPLAIKPRLRDMSLVYGGLIDVGTEWVGGVCGHRDGRDVDFEVLESFTGAPYYDHDTYYSMLAGFQQAGFTANLAFLDVGSPTDPEGWRNVHLHYEDPFLE